MSLFNTYVLFGRTLPDSVFLKIMYYHKFKRRLNLKNPKSFNEKIQWLKLYDRKPEYTIMVDKYEAKKYVASRIGEECIIPTLGVWDKFDDIDFDALPDQFVLKCTHDSGGLVICRDKSTFDRESARKKINRCLRKNYYWVGREWPYKAVPRRIIAEKYMEDESGIELNDYETLGGGVLKQTGCNRFIQRKMDSDEMNYESLHCKKRELIDYKFYCFSGEPKYLYVSEGLENHATATISFFTLDWEFAPFGRTDYKPFKALPKKPQCFDEMKEIATKLSQGYPFLRVDLYEVNGQVYFSELTFSPCSGLMPFNPPEWDEKLGRKLVLPNK